MTFIQRTHRPLVYRHSLSTKSRKPTNFEGTAFDARQRLNKKNNICIYTVSAYIQYDIQHYICSIMYSMSYIQHHKYSITYAVSYILYHIYSTICTTYIQYIMYTILYAQYHANIVIYTASHIQYNICIIIYKASYIQYHMQNHICNIIHAVSRK